MALVRGESNLSACGPLASFSVHLVNSALTPAGSGKSRGDNVGRMWVQLKASDFLALECYSMLYVCVRSVMDVVFSVCIVTRRAVRTRVWEV